MLCGWCPVGFPERRAVIRMGDLHHRIAALLVSQEGALLFL